ncbi:salivary antigen-5-like isoform X1 [Rhodnius prolixus]|uniref:salivary antigen-5-like isoform X1 n=1 Tax=Rhodnius prolixus TaxID=13249 RepID=UPI003D188479
MVQYCSLEVGLLASIVLLSSMVLVRPGPRPVVKSDPLRDVRKSCKNPSKEFIGLKNIDEKDKQLLLKEHNQYREKVAAGQEPPQPKAENMILLTWDSDAALQAKAWASGCDYGHNNPEIKKTKKPMGQNIYMKSSTENGGLEKTFKKYIPEMVKGWYDEVKLYTFGDAFSVKTGHYTQIVWKNTTKVGCGYSYFKERTQGNDWYSGYLVCNYSPAGNWYGEAPYKEGSGTCPGKFLEVASKQYPHLCKKKKKKSS